MFDLFRSRERNTRILLGALLLVVALSMLVYLIPGGLGGGDSATGDNIVASVGGEKITTADVQRSIQGITRGQNLPKGLLAMYMPNIVNQLVESKAMAYQARQMGLSVSDQELAETIQAEFAAQMGGKFDMNAYQGYLSQQGLTAAQFEKAQRDDMLASRLETLERQSILVSDADARAEYQRKNLKVGLQYIAFEGKDFLAKVNHDPAAIKAYFEKNRDQFKIPEKRDVSLIIGSTAAFLQTAKVSDAELHQEYQDSIDSFRTPERVQIRHILIKTQGKPKSEDAGLKAKAEDILKQVKAGANFADLAKKDSEDPGSAEKGGELGFITRGQTVPNFEKVAFSLKPGETSGVVETEYGFHILQCEQKQEAHTESFEEAKPQLLAEAQKQQGTDALNRAMDTAHDQVSQNPGKAQEIAAKLGLQFSKYNGMTAGTPVPDMSDATQFSTAIFATAKGGVTDVVNSDKQGKSAFAVVENVIPTHNAQYGEVQEQVVARYNTDESNRLAAEAAQAAAARVHKGESLETIAKDDGLSVKTAAPFTMDGAAEGIGSGTQVAAVFKANQGDVVGPITVNTSGFLCQVTQKIPADMNLFAQNKKSIVDELLQQRLQVQSPLFRDSIVADLKKHGKIKTNDATISRLIGSLQG
jgi:peptidyl-prolyl cis-trans isomerase D